MVATVPYVFSLLRGKLRAALIDANFAYLLSLIQQGSGMGPFQPRAGLADSITTGGVAVTIVEGPTFGGYVVNPYNAAAQGIVNAESLYLDPTGAEPGDTDAAANNTTVALAPGQSFQLPSLAVGSSIAVNAASNGHKFTVVVW